jgi:5-methyltetrahydrofolate--homocysteine methyltransferase
MSTTMLEIKNVMKALENAKLRDGVKIIIGGAPITQEFVEDIGADAYAKNAINGVKICRSWVQE